MRKLKKFSKLSNKTITHLVEAFVLGIPALSAASYARVHRNTANKFFKHIRTNIALHETQSKSRLNGELELDESYFGGRRKGNRGRHSPTKRIVFGILERKGQVRTVIVEDVTAATLMQEIVTHTDKGSVYYTDQFRSYRSLCLFGKHYSINHQKTFGKFKYNHINGIEGFWSFAKKFMSKYNGVSRDNFPFYLKEVEWRFNMRNHKDIIFQEVMKLL